MPKYVKKPLVVEAVHFDPASTGFQAALEEMEAFASDKVRPVDPEDWEDPDVQEMEVFDTLHNTWVTFYENDWVIKGVKGEFYPHNGEIFFDVYEEYRG